MPTLVLIRHAKAEKGDGDDHARRLNERGRAQSVDLGDWLREQGIAPDRALVSTAARAEQTWTGTGLEGETVLAPELYLASALDLRELVEQTGDDVGTLVLVGHNPAMEQLAWQLDDSDGARDRTNGGMGTSGAAVFELDAWRAANGTLMAFR
jgi:phosphohistidine phosphatase